MMIGSNLFAVDVSFVTSSWMGIVVRINDLRGAWGLANCYRLVAGISCSEDFDRIRWVYVIFVSGLGCSSSEFDELIVCSVSCCSRTWLQSFLRSLAILKLFSICFGLSGLAPIALLRSLPLGIEIDLVLSSATLRSSD